MSKVSENNLEAICRLMSLDIERWRKNAESALKAAGWVVIPQELFIGEGADVAWACHKGTGQIVEVRLDRNDDATEIESEVLDALITRVSTLEERFDKSDLKQDIMRDSGL